MTEGFGLDVMKSMRSMATSRHVDSKKSGVRLPLELLEFGRVEGVVPANVDEDLDPSIELEKRLRRWIV